MDKVMGMVMKATDETIWELRVGVLANFYGETVGGRNCCVEVR